MLTPEEIIELSSLVSRVHVEDELLDYVVRLARHTREHAQVYLGASPRASLALVKAARARALLSGRAFALPDDVKALAGPVWAHRLVLTPEAEMEERRAEEIIDRALAEVPTRGTAR